MPISKWLRLLTWAFFLLLTPGHAAPDQTNDPAKEKATPPTPLIAFDTPVEQFNSRLRPLSKNDLSNELKAWMRHAQEEISRTSEINVQMQAEGLEQQALEELKQKRTAQHDREYHLYKKVKRIIEAYEAKGGDASAEKQYLAAVSHSRSGANNQGLLSTILEGLSSWINDPEGGIAFVKKLIQAAAILVLFWLIAKLANRFIKKILERQRGLSMMLKQFIERSVKSVVLAIGGLFAIASLGANIGPIIAAMGAGGFIIGFALKETLGNFASGLMVMFYQPFDVDHFVEVNGKSGTVQKMSLVSTTLLTPDNKELIIPNNSVWGNTIINYSSQDLRRVDLVFGISYSDDIQKAVSLLNETTQSHSKILQNPEPEIAVDALADSSVNLICRPWVKSKDYWAVYRELMWKVKDRFDQENISIPFPQRDIHIQPNEPESTQE